MNAETYFTDPSDGEDRTILNRLTDQIDSLLCGDKLRMSFYLVTITDMGQAIVDAHRRGVDVEMMLNDTEIGRTAQAMLDAGVPIWTGPRLGNSINHQKILTYQRENGDSGFMVTSFNPTWTQLDRYNNLITLEDKDLATWFIHAYFPRLKIAHWGGWTHDREKQQNGDFYHRTYIFPREDDLVLHALNSVSDGDTSVNANKVWLAWSKFTKPREDIARRLAELSEQGRNVRVALGSESHYTWLSSWIEEKRCYFVPKLHHKFLLLDCEWGGTYKQGVFTGSHNLTGAGLEENDEILLRSLDSSVVDEYRKCFWTLRRAHEDG